MPTLKIYTYYRKGIRKWRSEAPKDGVSSSRSGLKHLAYGLTKEECEEKALKKLSTDPEALFRAWLKRP